MDVEGQVECIFAHSALKPKLSLEAFQKHHMMSIGVRLYSGQPLAMDNLH